MNPVQESFSNDLDVFVAKFSLNGISLIYSTYIGSSDGITEVTGISLDTQNNLFLTGYTNSLHFPITLDANQINNNGIYDIFVSKLDASGKVLIYSSYLGGQSYDVSNNIAIDNFGN